MKQKGHVWAAAFVVALCIAFSALTSAESPSWWTTRGVLNTNWPANDYAPVLAGQLKWMATNAAAELETLPGGAGTGVHALVSGFTLSNNYIPINLGQLKNTAVPFYQRLMAVGYATNYHWTVTTADDADFAPAMLGQLKYVFDFDVSTDSDDDGLPDWWETKHFGNIETQIGEGDPDDDGQSNRDEYETGTNPTNPNDPPNVKGTILYSGQQSNVIRVLAVTDSDSWGLTHSATITQPGSYQIANLPSTNHYLRAFRDLDNDGVLSAIEARGEYSGNPFEVTGQVTGVDITLIDPDADADGMPDWWELRYGLNPSSGVSETLATWWKFDEGEGTNVGNKMGVAYAGQMVNMSTSSWTTGKLGQALSFDGADDYVRVVQSPAIITGSQFTVSAWTWYDGSAADTYPTVMADLTNCGSAYSGFWLGYDQYYGGVEGLFGSCGYVAPFAPIVITGRWVHLALTHDGTNGSLYADGIRVAVVEASFTPAEMAEIRIGWADDPAYAYHWKGKLDDVRLYTSALTSNQIASMYDACLDLDGDEVDNFIEYQQGRDPTKGAQADSEGGVNLAVYTPMEG